MSDAAKFDSLNARAIERFGRPVPDLTRDELIALYRERGIMPAGRPDLRVIDGGSE